MKYDNCPHCNVSLLAEPVPIDSLHLYGGIHFKREVGVQVRGFFDGVAYFECPDCKGKWGDRLEEYEKWSKK